MDSDVKQLLNIVLFHFQLSLSWLRNSMRETKMSAFHPRASLISNPYWHFLSVRFREFPIERGSPPLQWMPFKDLGPFDLLSILLRVSSAFNTPSRVKSIQLQGLVGIFQPGTGRSKRCKRDITATGSYRSRVRKEMSFESIFLCRVPRRQS